MSLSERLKTARISLNKSQRDMSSAVGSSFGVWQAYESGKSVPGGNVLEALARMGFNVNWLLTGEGEMKVVEEESAQPIQVATGINESLLKAAIEAIEEYLQEVNGTLPPDKKAELVLLVCKLHTGKPTVEKATVISLFKLAS